MPAKMKVIAPKRFLQVNSCLVTFQMTEHLSKQLLGHCAPFLHSGTLSVPLKPQEILWSPSEGTFIFMFCAKSEQNSPFFLLTSRNLCEAQFSQHELCRNNWNLNQELRRITEHVFSSKATWRLKAAIFISQGEIQYWAGIRGKSLPAELPHRATLILSHSPASTKPPQHCWALQLFPQSWLSIPWAPTLQWERELKTNKSHQI